MLSSIITDSLQRLFLSFEDYIYYNIIKDKPDEHSQIKFALKAINVPLDLAKKVRSLRNLASHGYIINESAISSFKTQELTIPFIISTLEEFSQFIKDNQPQMYKHYSQVVRNIFVEVITAFKYKKIVQTSEDVLNNYPNCEFEMLKNKNLFVERSIMNISKLERLVEIIECKPLLIEINVKTMPCKLYLTCHPKKEYLIKQFCEKNALSIVKFTENRIKKTYYIE